MNLCLGTHMERSSKDSLWESFLSFRHVSPRDPAQVVRLVSKGLYLPSRLLVHDPRSSDFCGDSKMGRGRLELSVQAGLVEKHSLSSDLKRQGFELWGVHGEHLDGRHSQYRT